MVTFVLCDKTKTLLENGLTVRIFHRSQDSLPQIHGLDDIVIVRNVKVDNLHPFLDLQLKVFRCKKSRAEK